MSKLKYGQVDGKAEEIYTAGAFKASQKLLARSARFVIYDASDALWVTIPNDAAAIGGYVDEVLTTASVDGATRCPIRSVRGNTYELPYAAAGAPATLTQSVAATLIGKFIDIYVAADETQYADNAANQAILRVDGYNVNENTLIVGIKDSAITQQD